MHAAHRWVTGGDDNGPTLEVALQLLADERELGRQRMRALGLGESEIDAVLAYAERLHASQVSWAGSVISQRCGLVSLQ